MASSSAYHMGGVYIEFLKRAIEEINEQGYEPVFWKKEDEEGEGSRARFETSTNQ